MAINQRVVCWVLPALGLNVSGRLVDGWLMRYGIHHLDCTGDSTRLGLNETRLNKTRTQ